MEQIAWADKNKTLPLSDVRRLWREEDTAELKSKFNANAVEADAHEAATDAHEASTSNPHNVTKTQVGLSNVDNTADSSKPVSTAQAAAIAVVQNDVNAHEALTSNPHSVTKTQVGLSNVDNTADINKPISNATQTALNLKTTTTNFAKGILPTGAIDGVNMVYTLPHAMVVGTEDVFLNTGRLTDGIDYGMTYPGDVPTVTFIVFAPQTGDILRMNYIRP